MRTKDIHLKDLILYGRLTLKIAKGSLKQYPGENNKVHVKSYVIINFMIQLG